MPWKIATFPALGVGVGVIVGGNGVAVGGTGVSVGRGVFVGGIGVEVGGTGVGLGGTGVLVGVGGDATGDRNVACKVEVRGCAARVGSTTVEVGAGAAAGRNTTKPARPTRRNKTAIPAATLIQPGTFLMDPGDDKAVTMSVAFANRSDGLFARPRIRASAT